MGSKIILAVLAIAISVATIQGYDKNDLTDLNPAVMAVEALIEQVKKLVDAAIVSISDALKTIVNFSEEILNKFLESAKKACGQLVEQVRKIADAATGAGFDITACSVDGVIATLTGLPQKFLEQASVCTDGIIDKATKILEEGKKKLYALLDNCEALLEKAVGCHMSISCWSEVTVQAAQKTIEIPAAMSDMVLNICAEILKLKDNLGTCSVETLAHLTAEANDVVANFTTCVKHAEKH